MPFSPHQAWDGPQGPTSPPLSSRKAWEKPGSSKAPGGLKTSPNKGPFLQHSFRLQGNASLTTGASSHRASPGLEGLPSGRPLCSRAGRAAPSKSVLFESVFPLMGLGQGLLGGQDQSGSLRGSQTLTGYVSRFSDHPKGCPG